MALTSLFANFGYGRGWWTRCRAQPRSPSGARAARWGWRLGFVWSLGRRVGGARVRACSGLAAAGRRRCGAGPRRAWVRLLVPFGCAGLGWFGKLTAMAAIGSVRARAGNRSCVLRVARCAGFVLQAPARAAGQGSFGSSRLGCGFGRAPASIRWCICAVATRAGLVSRRGRGRGRVRSCPSGNSFVYFRLVGVLRFASSRIL